MLANRSQQMGRVLVIAGSDPSGGAGIQADIKTITMLGQYAATALTAITVQNTQGVTAVEAISESVIAGQIDAVLRDIGADVIKTGMLHSESVIEAVLDSVNQFGFTGQWVVDPVMVATSGDRLLDETAIDMVRQQLIPAADVLTPNIPEAEVLTGQAITCLEDMRGAGKALMQMGAGAVVMKGGHMQNNTLVDLCMQSSGETIIENRRIDTKHTHGTGCTLASAIAAELSAGQSLDTAFRAAVGFVRQAIERAPGFGAGNGPLGHARVLR